MNSVAKARVAESQPCRRCAAGSPAGFHGPKRVTGACLGVCRLRTEDEEGEFSPMDVHGFVVIFTRLGVAALLLLIAVAFGRVLIQLRVERRREERLFASRDIFSLYPSDPEVQVGALFGKTGYRAEQTGGKGDRGIDLLVCQNGKTCVAQCKRCEEDVGPSAVRELGRV